VATTILNLYHTEMAEVRRYSDHFNLVPAREFPITCSDAFFLWADTSGLSLHRNGDRTGIKTNLSDVRQRLDREAPLARAIDVAAKPSVLDVMAGLGRDGFTLGFLGCNVHMVERAEPIWALADDAQQRHGHPHTAVELGDGWQVLDANADNVQTVYLDAMYPPGKKALPGKEMQYLRSLSLEDYRDLSEWISLARSRATQRVVLKRRPRDKTVGSPAWQIRTKKVRFDVYRPG
jgi:16S rRNA (guanine1516-N2)-methyltransferase